MLEKNEIQLNYRRTMQQADELTRIARQFASLSNQAEGDAMQIIQNSWSGENSADFSKKGRRITRIMKEHSNTLQKTAEVLRTTAKNTYNAEMRNVEIAERRKFR